MTQTSIFDTAWDTPEGEFGEQEKELKRNELKRQFESSYDSAVDLIIKLKRKQAEILKNKLQSFDLNTYRSNASEIEDYENAQKDVAKRYLEFFGEELNRK